MNEQKLNKLFELATGKRQTVSKISELKKKVNGRKLDKVKGKLDKYTKSYTSPIQAWTAWYNDSKKDISEDTANQFWEYAKNQFPGTEDEAKDFIRKDFDSSVDSKDIAIKEQKMKNELGKYPSWLRSEKIPELDITGAAVSSQNLTKTKLLYKKVLEDKLNKLNLTELDPDVPVEVHVDDLLKLELFNQLDAAQVVNGRLFVNNGNESVPAFSLTEAEEDLGPEAEIIYSIAPDIFAQSVSTAIQNSQENQGISNRASSGLALNMLQNGDLPVEEWGSAMSLLGNPDSIEKGFNGLVRKDPYMTDEDVDFNVNLASDLYGEV